MGSTQENLKHAFAGESQANQKYLAFATRADAENLPNIARLFRAAAAAESVHARNHLNAVEGVAETLENLKAAQSGEQEEVRDMYPPFVEQAREEGNDDARESFEYALEVEKIHHNLYSKAIDRLESGKDLPPKLMFVCRGCGNTEEGAPPQKCPVCGAPQHWFMLIG